MNINGEAIGTTSTAILQLINSVAATVGAQQMSPAIELTGQGWKTNATAGSQAVNWRIENLPVQGTASPSTNLNFSSQVNGGGFTTRATLDSNGILTLANLASGLITSASGVLTSNTGTAAGSIPYWATTTTLGSTAANSTATPMLLHQSSSGAPTWSQVDLAADVTGVLSGTNGGTGQAVRPVADSQGTTTYTTGVSSGVETTVYTANIAANSLGNNGRAKFSFAISLQNPVANTTTYVVKIKIGATTFVTSATISPNANTTSTYLFEGGLVNQGATNANTFYGKSSVPPITGDGTSTGVASTDLRIYNDGLTLNTTGSLTVTATVTPTTGGSGNATGGKFKCSMGIIQVYT